MPAALKIVSLVVFLALSASGVSPAEVPVARVFQPAAEVVVETSVRPEVHEILPFDVSP